MTLKEFPVNKILFKLHFRDNASCVVPSARKTAVLTYSIQVHERYLNSVSMNDFFTRIAVMNLHQMFFLSSRKILLSLAACHQPFNMLAHKVKVLLESPLIEKEKVLGFGFPDFANRKSGVKNSDLNLYN